MGEKKTAQGKVVDPGGAETEIYLRVTRRFFQ